MAQTLSRSFAGAREVAAQYPAHAPQIIAAARLAFTQGSQTALLIGVVAAAMGAFLTFALFPSKAREDTIYAQVALASAQASAAVQAQEDTTAGVNMSADTNSPTGVAGVTSAPSPDRVAGGVVRSDDPGSGASSGALGHEQLDDAGRSAAPS